MGTLRYAINVTLDGCVHHTGVAPDGDLHVWWGRQLTAADALLYGRVTYEMMREAWAGEAGQSMPDEESRTFARSIDVARKYVVSRTLGSVDWNAELVTGDLAEGVRRVKAAQDGLILTGGVVLPNALAALGLIDEYLFVVHPRVVGSGPALLAGLPAPLDLELVAREELSGGAVASRYVPAG